MAYPYTAPANNKADATVTATDHPAHHNALANALIDLLAELGAAPKGGAASLTARLTALDSLVALKAALASPALTGNPTAPTQNPGTNNTRLANTAYADAAVAAQAAIDIGTYELLGAAQRGRFGPPRPQVRAVALIAAASHGWTVGGAGSSNSNDTADYMIGDRSFRATSNGTGGQVSLDKTGLSLDLTGKSLVVWLKVDDLSKLNTITLLVGNDAASFTNYWTTQIGNPASWSTGNNIFKSGEWVRFTIPRGDFTVGAGAPTWTGVQRVRIAFTDRSAGAAVVRTNGVGMVDEPSTTYISLTFDDSYVAHDTVCRAYMEKYGFVGTLFPIVSAVDSGASWLTTARIKAMMDAGWEVGAHALDGTSHGGIEALTQAQRITEFAGLRAWLRTIGSDSEVFAYGNGTFDTASRLDVRRFFPAGARTVYYRTHQTFPPLEPTLIRAVNPTSMNLASMQAEVDNAITGKAWLVFIFHDVNAGGTGTNAITTANFQSLMDYINGKGTTVSVLPMGDVLRKAA